MFGLENKMTYPDCKDMAVLKDRVMQKDGKIIHHDDFTVLQKSGDRCKLTTQFVLHETNQTFVVVDKQSENSQESDKRGQQ